MSVRWFALKPTGQGQGYYCAIDKYTAAAQASIGIKRKTIERTSMKRGQSVNQPVARTRRRYARALCT